MEQTMTRIAELKDKYPDEWLLVEVIESDEEGQPTQVKLIEHSSDRDDTYDALTQVEAGKRVYHFFNGTIPKEGYESALAVA